MSRARGYVISCLIVKRTGETQLRDYCFCAKNKPKSRRACFESAIWTFIIQPFSQPLTERVDFRTKMVRIKSPSRHRIEIVFHTNKRRVESFTGRFCALRWRFVSHTRKQKTSAPEVIAQTPGLGLSEKKFFYSTRRGRRAAVASRVYVQWNQTDTHLHLRLFSSPPRYDSYDSTINTFAVLTPNHSHTC